MFSLGLGDILTTGQFHVVFVDMRQLSVCETYLHEKRVPVQRLCSPDVLHSTLRTQRKKDGQICHMSHY